MNIPGLDSPHRQALTHPRTRISINEHWYSEFKNKGQKSTKEVLDDKLEVDFKSNQKIDWCQKVWTLKWHTPHELPQAYSGRNPYVRFE